MTYRLLPLLVSGYVGIGWHDLQAAPPVGARVCDVGTRALDHLSLREAQCAVVESVALLQVLDPIGVAALCQSWVMPVYTVVMKYVRHHIHCFDELWQLA